MVRIILTKEFEVSYSELPELVQRKAEKQQELFRNNPFYPSLNTEKLSPKSNNLWSFRVDKKYRVIFRFADNDKVYFLNIGPHDWIYKIKF